MNFNKYIPISILKIALITKSALIFSSDLIKSHFQCENSNGYGFFWFTHINLREHFLKTSNFETRYFKK